MVAGHLLAAPDRIPIELESLLGAQGITCEVEYTKECVHSRYIIDLTSLICRHEKTQVGLGVEKRRGRNGVDIIVSPECRSFFRRNLDSEKLAVRIVEILCQHGATKAPHARRDVLE